MRSRSNPLLVTAALEASSNLTVYGMGVGLRKVLRMSRTLCTAMVESALNTLHLDARTSHQAHHFLGHRLAFDIMVLSFVVTLSEAVKLRDPAASI